MSFEVVEGRFYFNGIELKEAKEPIEFTVNAEDHICHFGVIIETTDRSKKWGVCPFCDKRIELESEVDKLFKSKKD